MLNYNNRAYISTVILRKGIRALLREKSLLAVRSAFHKRQLCNFSGECGLSRIRQTRTFPKYHPNGKSHPSSVRAPFPSPGGPI